MPGARFDDYGPGGSYDVAEQEGARRRTYGLRTGKFEERSWLTQTSWHGLGTREQLGLHLDDWPTRCWKRTAAPLGDPALSRIRGTVMVPPRQLGAALSKELRLPRVVVLA